MPRVIARPDNLNELNSRFDQARLEVPVFLNSVPKCGTHLVRNIVRMFVAVDQQYHSAFIQIPVLRQHLGALSSKNPKLSWGHLLFSDESSIALRDVKHIVLVRDPYDWVLARARFFLSDNFEGNLNHLKDGAAPVEDILNMMIFGIYQKVPNLAEIFMHNGACWMGTHAHLVRYEDVITHLKHLQSEAAETYFANLLSQCGIASLPADWRERVRIGADRKQSGTARENLTQRTGEAAVPAALPDAQKALVDYAVPGLRKLLGYV